jgi:6-phosphofructokinase 1
VCVPASIDNNLPGAELSIGADTALNNIVWALDRVKQSASASSRCFVAETMGRRCGYLALMSGLAAGAERSISTKRASRWPRSSTTSNEMKRARFTRPAARLYLVVRNEGAERALHDERRSPGSSRRRAAPPSTCARPTSATSSRAAAPRPSTGVLATRLAAGAVDILSSALSDGGSDAVMIGLERGALTTHPISDLPALIDPGNPSAARSVVGRFDVRCPRPRGAAYCDNGIDSDQLNPHQPITAR